MPTHYDILKVAHDAPAEVVRAAYRALSQRHHPDRNPADPAAAARMQALNEAYAVLSDPPRRQAYDADLAREAGGAEAGPMRGTAAAEGALRPAGGRPTRPAPAAPKPTPGPAPDRQGRLLALGLLAIAATLGIATLAHDTGRRDAPAARVDAVEPAAWEIRGLDPPPRVRPQPAPTPRRAPEASVAAAAAPAAIPLPPSTASAPSTHAPGLPIVADPNGRPWPWQASEVEGLPRAHADGLATVTVDNRNNAWPAFVKLVALDDGRGEAVRHVYLPAMQVFRIDSIRAGRYELRFQNLVTGEVSRSGAFELRQVEQGDRVRFSELDVTLYRVPGGALGVAPLAPGEF